MSDLQNDIRQLFAHTVLEDFGRLQEADVGFTYVASDVFMSCFAQALDRIQSVSFEEHDSVLLQFAQVFERLSMHPPDGINRSTSGTVSAAAYWLCGFSANAMVMARLMQAWSEPDHHDAPLLDLLARTSADAFVSTGSALARYLTTGDPEALAEAEHEAEQRVLVASEVGPAERYLVELLMQHVIRRFGRVSLWSSISEASAPVSAWQQYMAHQLSLDAPLFDLWPSQRRAIERGLLDGRSSVVLRLPTSAGKTKVTELAFFNDLSTNDKSRCLYLAPFRSLVAEVERGVGGTLSALGFPVATLYGGSEANELELELAEVARVVIGTPEKVAAVLRAADGTLGDYDTIVLDEGHLLDSWRRGPAYELQLAVLRGELSQHGRVIFLSAVLPNAEEIAAWLGGSPEALVSDRWQPTTMRVGVVTWPKEGNPRLTYLTGSAQALTDRFFVPRVLEHEEWKERHPDTRRLRSYRFPERDNGSVSAALAFRYVRLGSVIIYSKRRDWAEGVAGRILDRLARQRPIETGLVDERNREQLDALGEYLTALLGPDAILSKAVRSGFAIHHAGLPHSVRLVVEDACRRQTIRLLIATSTLAQGVNLPAKTVIIHSLPHSDYPIRDFWNLAGRAGRAMKETEGEVIILATGSLKRKTLARFLRQDSIEAVESCFLAMVRWILDRYPLVNQESLDALFAFDDQNGIGIRESVAALDAFLLGAMAEDIDVDGTDQGFEQLVDNLFATYQASKHDLEEGTELTSGVRDLMRLRRSVVLDRVPDASTRRRFSRAGLAVDSCLTLEEVASVTLTLGASFVEPSREALLSVFEQIAQTRELLGESPSLMAQVGDVWMATGSYVSVLEAVGSFEELEGAVEFVEETIGYRVPWVLNGLMRIVESREGLPEPPVWLRLLPDMLRYGVRTENEVWVMSMGIRDPRLGRWVLNWLSEHGWPSPGSFRELVDFCLASEDEVIGAMRAQWPTYFAETYGESLGRYRRIQEILNSA